MVLPYDNMDYNGTDALLSNIQTPNRLIKIDNDNNLTESSVTETNSVTPTGGTSNINLSITNSGITFNTAYLESEFVGSYSQFFLTPYGKSLSTGLMVSAEGTGKVGILNNNPTFDVDINGDLNVSSSFICQGADSTKKMSLLAKASTDLPVTTAFPQYTSFPAFSMRPGNRTEGQNSGTPGSTSYYDLVFAHDNRWNIRTQGNDGIRISSPFGDIAIEAQSTKSINLKGANVKLNNVIIHSDDRSKINEIPITDAVNQIKNLNFYEYDKLDELNGTNVLFKERGVIAQEIQNTPLNFSVLESEEDGSLGVAYQNIFITLCQAVKDLTARIEILESAN